jgi:hypothetical protein
MQVDQENDKTVQEKVPSLRPFLPHRSQGFEMTLLIPQSCFFEDYKVRQIEKYLTWYVILQIE